MTSQRLGRIHVDNLCHLIELREAIQQDLGSACLNYGIDRQTAEAYGAASDEALHALAFSIDESLFTPRFHSTALEKYLRAPDCVRNTMATVDAEGSRHRMVSRLNGHKRA